MIVYPRLPQARLAAFIEQFRIDADLEASVHHVQSIIDASALAPGRVSHAVAGSALVEEAELTSLRRGLRAIAGKYGFPATRPAAGSPQWAGYDRETASYIKETMSVAPTDAASQDVWAHVNGWLAADVVYWRWGLPDPGSIDSGARFALGTRWFLRNQMGRLWWRAEILDDLYTKGSLGEDQAVALLERPSLGFNPPLARSIATEWIRRQVAGVSQVSSERLMRDATKRFRRLLPVLAIYSLSEADLGTLAAQVFDESESALIAPKR